MRTCHIASQDREGWLKMPSLMYMMVGNIRNCSEIVVHCQKKNNLSLKVNTDGVPIFKSSGFSLWPAYFEINELPPKKRRQVNNMILGGLWFGEHKPVMTTFLQPFKDALSTLET